MFAKHALYLTMKSTLDDRHLLEQGPVSRLFCKYALPSVVTVVFFGIQNIVDGVIVGNHIGPDAMGGINIILPLFNIMLVIALVVGIGSQTLVSLGLGGQNIARSQDAMTTGFWTLVLVGLLTTLLLMLLAEPLTRLMGADERLLPHALGYLYGLAPFTLPLILCFYSDVMLKALGYPKVSMSIMSSAVVLNMLLSLIFVIGLGWGTMGASIATGIAFSTGFLVSGRITFNRKQRLSMLKGRFRLPLLRNALYNGSSEGMSDFAASVSILIINLTVVRMLGADGVAAFTAINYINFTGVLLFLGISDGLIPVLSFNHGARNHARVRQIFRFAAKVNTCIGVCVFIVLQLFGDAVLLLFFDSRDSSAFGIAEAGLCVYAFAFLMNGLNVLITAYFTALGDARSSIIAATLRGLVFVLAGVAVLPKFFGVSGVWMAIPLAELLALGVASFLVLRANRTLLKPADD